MTAETVKQEIDALVYENENGEVSGQDVQDALHKAVDFADLGIEKTGSALKLKVPSNNDDQLILQKSGSEVVVNIGSASDSNANAVRFAGNSGGRFDNLNFMMKDNKTAKINDKRIITTDFGALTIYNLSWLGLGDSDFDGINLTQAIAKLGQKVVEYQKRYDFPTGTPVNIQFYWQGEHLPHLTHAVMPPTMNYTSLDFLYFNATSIDGVFQATVSNTTSHATAILTANRDTPPTSADWVMLGSGGAGQPTAIDTLKSVGGVSRFNIAEVNNKVSLSIGRQGHSGSEITVKGLKYNEKIEKLDFQTESTTRGSVTINDTAILTDMVGLPAISEFEDIGINDSHVEGKTFEEVIRQMLTSLGVYKRLRNLIDDRPMHFSINWTKQQKPHFTSVIAPPHLAINDTDILTLQGDISNGAGLMIIANSATHEYAVLPVDSTDGINNADWTYHSPGQRSQQLSNDILYATTDSVDYSLPAGTKYLDESDIADISQGVTETAPTGNLNTFGITTGITTDPSGQAIGMPDFLHIFVPQGFTKQPTSVDIYQHGSGGVSSKETIHVMKQTGTFESASGLTYNRYVGSTANKATAAVSWHLKVHWG